MKLSEGQVMDYVKSVSPYIDDRFLNAPQQIVTREEPRLTEEDVVSMQAIVAESPQSQVSIWEINNVPPVNPQLHPLLQPQLQNTFQPVQPTYAPLPRLPIMLDTSGVIREKIQSRRDALDSMDTKSPEMVATIKALDWVLETMARNAVSLTNGV